MFLQNHAFQACTARQVVCEQSNNRSVRHYGLTRGFRTLTINSPASALVKLLIIRINYRATCVRECVWEAASPRLPREILRETMLLSGNTLLLLLLKIKGSVMLLSRIRDNYLQRELRRGVFVCVVITMEPAGSLEFTCARTVA